MQNWQPRPSPVGHASVWPSTETHDKALTQHEGKDVLSKMLPKLSHMDLTGRVSNKSAAMQAHGGYCDVFVGSVASEHVGRRRTVPTGVGEVKVAIKRLRVRLGKDEKLAKSLAREIAIWSKLNHRNILPLLGYLLEEDYPSLISEWIENGTARDFLKNNPECDITHLALGIAEGLKYIHDQGVVHSDLKADNVLISQSGEPLICDFGISRMLNSSQTFFVSTTHDGSIKGSTRWMAIELYTPDGGADPKHTKETDVWAYGMTLYEMISKQVPFAQLKQDVQVLLAIIKRELPVRPTIDAQSSLFPLWSICESCWKTDPKDRFTMAQITWELVVLERMSKVQHRMEAASYQAGLANFSLTQQNRRPPNDMSLPPLARDKFVATLQDWWRRNGIKPDARMITIGNHQIDLHQLYTEVLQYGGVVNVRRCDLWSVIAAKMGWLPRIVEPSWTQERFAAQLEVVYEQLLEPFEVEYIAAATKQPLSSQVPQDAGQQGGASQPGAGSNERSRPHEQFSTQIHGHGELNEPTHQAYPCLFPTNPLPLSVHLMQTQQQRQLVSQPRLLATSTSDLELAQSPARAAFSPTRNSLKRPYERDNLAHSEITFLSDLPSETIPSKRVKPVWEGVLGAQSPSRQLKEEGFEAPERSAHVYSNAMRISEMDNPSVFPWDSKEPLLQPPKVVVPDFDILDVARSSSMTNMASTGTPSPGAVDGNYSLSPHLQQEDGKADPADLTPTPWTSQGSEYEASPESDYPSTRASAGSSPSELWNWNTTPSSRPDLSSIPKSFSLPILDYITQ